MGPWQRGLRVKECQQKHKSLKYLIISYTKYIYCSKTNVHRNKAFILVTILPKNEKVNNYILILVVKDMKESGRMGRCMDKAASLTQMVVHMKASGRIVCHTDKAGSSTLMV